MIEYFRSSRVIVEYSSSICVFHKKKASKEIVIKAKTGFLIEKAFI